MPYTCKAKLFRDSDQVVDLVWYPALPGAPMLNVAGMVLNVWLEPDGFFPPPGGIVERPEDTFNGEQTKPAAIGAHVCGSAEDFREGCAFLPDDPPVVYRPDGLPNCCIAGGAVGGGGAGGGDVHLATATLNTCTTRLPLVVDQWFTTFIPAGSGNATWYGVFGLNLVPYRIDVEWQLGNLFYRQDFWNTACSIPFQTAVNQLSTSPQCVDYVVGGQPGFLSTLVWFTNGPAGIVRWRLTEGTC